MLPGSTALDLFSDDALKGSNAHASLSMSCQCIMSSECVSAQARVGFGAGVDLGMSLQVVSSDEAFSAVIASELSVAKMGLYVRFDVLFTSKSLVAIFVFANPLVIHRIGSFNELGDIVEGDIGFFNGCTNAWFEIEV